MVTVTMVEQMSFTISCNNHEFLVTPLVTSGHQPFVIIRKHPSPSLPLCVTVVSLWKGMDNDMTTTHPCVPGPQGCQGSKPLWTLRFTSWEGNTLWQTCIELLFKMEMSEVNSTVAKMKCWIEHLSSNMYSIHCRQHWHCLQWPGIQIPTCVNLIFCHC